MELHLLHLHLAPCMCSIQLHPSEQPEQAALVVQNLYRLCLFAGSPVAGFARFLHLLIHHPWTDQPLVVDPSAELTPSQHKQLQASFDAGKAAGGVQGFTVCTPSDLGGSAWGQEGLIPAMRQRLVKLASKSLDIVKVSA